MTKSLRYSLISAVALVAAGSGLALAEPAAAPAPVVAQNEKPASELPPRRFGGHVHAFAVNTKTNELLLGARPIYRSADDGKTWKAVPDGKSPTFNMAMHNSPDATSWKGILEPGETAVVAVIYQPSLMPVEGSVTRNVKFATNDPQNPKVELGVHATVTGNTSG